MYIENFVQDTTLHIVDSGKEALKKLKGSDEYFLVISDYNLHDINGGDIYKFIKEKNLKTSFLLFSNDPPEMHSSFDGFYSSGQMNHYITKQCTPEVFRQKMITILKPTMVSQKPIKAFQEIKLSAFYRFNKVLCDVYLKLSDSRYYKAINQNEMYNYKKIDEFKEQGHTSLFIKNDDFLNFGVTFCRTPFLINEADKMSEDEKEQVIESTHKIIQETVTSFGMSREVIDLAVKNIEVISDILKNKNNLNKLLRPMQLNQNYIYDHSYMVCLVVGAICYQSKVKNWEHNAQNLCLAAILHDMTLVQSTIAELADLKPAKIKALGPDKVKLIEGHVHAAAKLAKSLGPTWSKVEEIILNHHETIDSKGYPKKIGIANLSELDCTFILGHDYVLEVYKSNFEPSGQEAILKKIYNKYSKGKTGKIVEHFLKNFNEGRKILKEGKVSNLAS